MSCPQSQGGRGQVEDCDKGRERSVPENAAIGGFVERAILSRVHGWVERAFVESLDFVTGRPNAGPDLRGLAFRTVIRGICVASGQLDAECAGSMQPAGRSRTRGEPSDAGLHGRFAWIHDWEIVPGARWIVGAGLSELTSEDCPSDARTPSGGVVVTGRVSTMGGVSTSSHR